MWSISTRGGVQPAQVKLTFTLTGNLELPINLISTSLNFGRKPRYPERAEVMSNTCKLHPERPKASP